VIGGHDRWVKRRAGRGLGVLPPSHPSLALGALHEVVATAEALAFARQQDRVDSRVEIGLLYALLQLAHETARDSVAALRAIEDDAGNAAGDFVGKGGGFSHSGGSLTPTR
jgi:hypothetical protein